jgi:hypothetical protein
MMAKFFLHKVIVLLLICLFTSQYSFSNDSKKYYISNYGAVNDGKTLNTLPIQKAIDEASQNGGGLVVFPKGKYLTGSIILKSEVTLYLEEGSVILGSTNPEDYPRVEIKDAPLSPNESDNSKLALILSFNAKNVGIIGKGTIDGQGRKLALTIDSLYLIANHVDTRHNKRPHETLRPKLTIFMDCENVTISGVSIKNASCWVMTYELCKNVNINNINVESRAYWNNDGMDITDCKNVRITNCDVNTADDGICLKSYYPGYFNDSIYIANCTIRSSASAIKFGTASHGGFRNVVIENIKVYDTYRSAIAIESVDGGFIENVSVSNIVAKNTGNAFFIRLGHRSGAKPGTIKNISIKNVKVQVPFNQPDLYYELYGPALPFMHNPFPSPICGIPDNYIENIHLENIEISYPGRASKGMAYIPVWYLHSVPECIKDYPEFSMFGELPSWGFYVRHVKGITMKNIKMKLEKEDFRPAFVFDDVQGVKMEKIQLPKDKKEHFILKDVKDINIDNEAKQFIK